MEAFKWPVRDFNEYMKRQAVINDRSKAWCRSYYRYNQRNESDVVIVATGARQIIPDNIDRIM